MREIGRLRMPRGTVVILSGLICAAAAVETPRVVGWRTDWTGRYPDATPVTEWSRLPVGPLRDLRFQAEKPGPGDDGRGAQPVARNRIPMRHRDAEACIPLTSQEIFHSSPVFDGKFIYIRGERNLYCIGER